MKDFLTIKDSLLVTFGRRFINGYGQVASLLGVSGDKLIELESVIGEYEETLSEIQAARSHLKSLQTKKNGLRDRLKELLRALASKARTDTSVTDEQIAGMGLKPRDRTRTALKPPAGAPYLTLEIHRQRRHSLTIFDYGNSLNKAKPEGVIGAEIWVFLGSEAAMNEKELRYLGTATRSKFTYTHDEEDAGKQAQYVARWINRRGERGGWSNSVSATIAH